MRGRATLIRKLDLTMIYDSVWLITITYTIKVGQSSERNSPLVEASCQRVADRWLRAGRHRRALQACSLLDARQCLRCCHGASSPVHLIKYSQNSTQPLPTPTPSQLTTYRLLPSTLIAAIYYHSAGKLIVCYVVKPNENSIHWFLTWQDWYESTIATCLPLFTFASTTTAINGTF